jgi:hypothetical protein
MPTKSIIKRRRSRLRRRRYHGRRTGGAAGLDIRQLGERTGRTNRRISEMAVGGSVDVEDKGWEVHVEAVSAVAKETAVTLIDVCTKTI